MVEVSTGGALNWKALELGDVLSCDQKKGSVLVDGAHIATIQLIGYSPLLAREAAGSICDGCRLTCPRGAAARAVE